MILRTLSQKLKSLDFFDKVFVVFFLLIMVYTFLNVDYPFFGNGDLSNDYLVAKNIIEHREFPTLGPGNGVFGGRINSFSYYYLIAGILLFGGKMMSLPYIGFLLLGVGMILLYLLAKKMFSSKTALLASLIIFLNPFTLQNLNKFWPASVVFPLVLLSYILLFKSKEKKDSKLIYLSIFLIMLALSFHNAVLAILPAFFMGVIYLQFDKNNLKKIFLSIATFVASFILFYINIIYFAFKDPNSGDLFYTLKTSIQAQDIFFQGSSLFSRLVESLNTFLRFVTSLPQPGTSVEITIFTGFIFVFGIMIAYYLKNNNRPKQRYIKFLTLSFFSFIFFASLVTLAGKNTSSGFLPLHYFLPILPIFGILVAELMVSLSNKIYPYIAIPLLILILFFTSFQFGLFQNFKKELSLGLVQTNYSQINEITDAVVKKIETLENSTLPNIRSEFFIKTHTQNSHLDYSSLFLVPLQEKLNQKLTQTDIFSTYMPYEQTNFEIKEKPIVMVCVKSGTEQAEECVPRAERLFINDNDILQEYNLYKNVAEIDNPIFIFCVDLVETTNTSECISKFKKEFPNHNQLEKIFVSDQINVFFAQK